MYVVDNIKKNLSLRGGTTKQPRINRVARFMIAKGNLHLSPFTYISFFAFKPKIVIPCKNAVIISKGITFTKTSLSLPPSRNNP
jgi:hypothetical protein